MTLTIDTPTGPAAVHAWRRAVTDLLLRGEPQADAEHLVGLRQPALRVAYLTAIGRPPRPRPVAVLPPAPDQREPDPEDVPDVERPADATPAGTVALITPAAKGRRRGVGPRRPKPRKPEPAARAAQP